MGVVLSRTLELDSRVWLRGLRDLFIDHANMTLYIQSLLYLYIPPARTHCAVSAIPLSMCYLDDQVDHGNRPVSTMQIVVIWVCLGCT